MHQLNKCLLCVFVILVICYLLSNSKENYLSFVQVKDKALLDDVLKSATQLYEGSEKFCCGGQDVNVFRPARIYDSLKAYDSPDVFSSKISDYQYEVNPAVLGNIHTDVERYGSCITNVNTPLLQSLQAYNKTMDHSSSINEAFSCGNGYYAERMGSCLKNINLEKMASSCVNNNVNVNTPLFDSLQAYEANRYDRSSHVEKYNVNSGLDTGSGLNRTTPYVKINGCNLNPNVPLYTSLQAYDKVKADNAGKYGAALADTLTTNLERFRNYIIDTESKKLKPTITYYTMKNCPFCVKFDNSGVFDSMRSIYGGYIEFEKVDKKDAPNYITSYPSIIAEIKGKIYKYEGDRSIQDMSNWIEYLRKFDPSLKTHF